MAPRSSLFDNFVFYNSYHMNAVNVAIHIVCVWPILFTGQQLLAYTPSMGAVPLSGGVLAEVNGALVGTAVYVLYYLSWDRRAGLAAAMLVVLGYLGCQWVKANFSDTRTVVAYAAGINVACWVAQIFGHQVFEGRAPALLNNLAQAFLMAPFFVLLEVLMHFGYEPEPGFTAAVHAEVTQKRAEFERSRAGGSNNSTTVGAVKADAPSSAAVSSPATTAKRRSAKRD